MMKQERTMILLTLPGFSEISDSPDDLSIMGLSKCSAWIKSVRSSFQRSYIPKGILFCFQLDVQRFSTISYYCKYGEILKNVVT